LDKNLAEFAIREYVQIHLLDIGSCLRTSRAGEPTTTELSATSLLTTEPAPITTFSPMLTPGRIQAFVPIEVKLPIEHRPVIRTPGEISTKSPTVLPCETEACTFNSTPLPIFTFEVT